MAKEKVTFTDMNSEDLATEVRRMEAEYNQMKFDHATRGMANPMEIREQRHAIARAKTEIRAREVAQFTPEQIELRSKIRARRRKGK